MNKDGGFIKVYRSMLQWEWHDDPITVATWMYCLMRANYETQRWHGQIVEPGQFITSLKHMAKDIGISVRQLRTALNHLKSTHEVTSQATNNATLITVVKWALYQSAGEKATRLATHEATNDRQTTDKRPTTIEERKEREEREELRESIERRSNMPVIPDEATYNVDGETYHYVNGVLQYTPEETRQLLKTAHEQFAPIKKRLMEEAKHHDQM